MSKKISRFRLFSGAMIATFRRKTAKVSASDPAHTAYLLAIPRRSVGTSVAQSGACLNLH